MSEAKGVAERLLALEAAVAGLQKQMRTVAKSRSGAAEPAKRAPEGPADPPAAESEAGSEGALKEAGEPSGPDRLAQALGNSRLAAVLVRAGFPSPEDVAAASDEALLAVEGLGEKALRSVREKVG